MNCCISYNYILNYPIRIHLIIVLSILPFIILHNVINILAYQIICLSCCISVKHYWDIAYIRNLNLDHHYQLIYDDILWCKNICKKGSVSFYTASQLYHERVKYDVYGLYAFCRITDDLIDECNDIVQQKKNMKLMLDYIDFVYENRNYMYGSYQDNIIKLLNDNNIDVDENIIKSFRFFRYVIYRNNIQRKFVELLLHGYQWDIDNHQIITEQDLIQYSIYVASSVGLICSCIYGADMTDSVLVERAADYGIGLQLINISRDIITDKKNSRNYIPINWFEDNEIITEDIIDETNNILCKKYADRLIALADIYFDNAQKGIGMLPIYIWLPLKAALLIYREIGVQIYNNDIYMERSVVNNYRKLYLIFKSLMTKHSKLITKNNIMVNKDVSHKQINTLDLIYNSD